MQQYSGVYLLQNYSTCFECLSHTSTFRQRRLIRPRWRKVVALTRDMTYTRSCS